MSASTIPFVSVGGMFLHRCPIRRQPDGTLSSIRLKVIIPYFPYILRAPSLAGQDSKGLCGCGVKSYLREGTANSSRLSGRRGATPVGTECLYEGLFFFQPEA